MTDVGEHLLGVAHAVPASIRYLSDTRQQTAAAFVESDAFVTFSVLFRFDGMPLGKGPYCVLRGQ
jgi:hypothetical protein